MSNLSQITKEIATVEQLKALNSNKKESCYQNK